MIRTTLIACPPAEARHGIVRAGKRSLNTPVLRSAPEDPLNRPPLLTSDVVQQYRRPGRSKTVPPRGPMLVRQVVAFLLAITMAAGLFALRASAQVAGPNINVLPVLTDQNGNPITPAQDPQAAYKGDYYLNRQVEATIGASTRNPQHVAAFFNDYRAVDIQEDLGHGEQQVPVSNLLARVWRSLGGVWAKLTGRRTAVGDELPEEEESASAFWAWIGGSRSSDGGQTWSGFMLPGAPFDSSPASVNSPVQGLEAATDPKAVWGPCGKLYVAYIAFTKEGNSKVAVARYEDVNPPVGEWLKYIDTVVVEEGKNDRNGHFHDLPAIAVDYNRGGSTDPCAHNVYVAWARFNGVDSNGKFHSIMNFARSTDQGQTYVAQKIDGNYTTGQGAAIAIDPRPGRPSTAGTPSTGGGGTVYVAWRTFGGPHTILVNKSTTFGATFQNQPLDILAPGQLQRFDQPTLSTTAVAPSLIQARSLAVPTIAVSGTGTVFVAWQERVNITACPGGAACGQPRADGSPRIVLVLSANQGATWTAANGGAIAGRRAIDFGDRDSPNDPSVPAPGFGVLPQPRASGPQIQPKLTAGPDSVLLSYYESRGILSGNDTYQLADIGPPPGAPYTAGFISGIDRWMDFRTALLNPSTGSLVGTSQVSRYPIRKNANLATEGLDDVEAANPPCVRKVNRVGVPTTEAGVSPYIGDYHGASAAVDFVPTADGWRWAITAADVPYRGFRTAFSDLRNQVPPTWPPDKLEWERYRYYQTPGSTGFAPGECNAGSRNADVLTAITNAEVIVGAPATFKKLGQTQASYPFFVQNPTNVYRYYRLTMTTGADVSSLSQTADDDSDDVEVYQFSGITRVVYVAQTAPANTTVRVLVQEITAIGGGLKPNGLTGTVILNGDSSTPLADSTETHTPLPTTPLPTTPLPTTPLPTTPLPTTSSFGEPRSITWSAKNTGGTSTAYKLFFHIDNAPKFLENYAFQLVVWKNASNGAPAGCNALALPQSQVLVNITNPLPTTPLPTTPLPTTPLPTTATFAIAPSETGSTGNAASSEAITLAAVNDGTLKAPLAADQVFITWIGYQKKRDCQAGELDTALCVSTTEKFQPDKDPPALTMQSQSCNGSSQTDCPVAFVGPDLIVSPTTPITASGTIFKTFLDFPASPWTLLNQGPQSALTTAATAEDGAFIHRIYLSADEKIDSSDVLLATAGTTTGTLDAFATPCLGTNPCSQTFGKVTVKKPARTPAGPAFLCLSLDDDREISELEFTRGESNNVKCVAVTVQ
jgi:hypothetical protein